MTFQEIEQRRSDAGIEQLKLCRRANVHKQTYSRLKHRKGRFGASELTLRKLSEALDELIDERETATRGERP